MKKKKRNPYFTIMFKLCRHQWSRNSVERKKCFVNSKIEIEKLGKWICAECENYFALSEVDCDHIHPIGNTVPKNEEEFIESFKKLHCLSEDLQILCKKCHRIKTRIQMNEKTRKTIIDSLISITKRLGYDEFIVNTMTNRDIKRLLLILNKIEISESRDREIWRKKLSEFLETHG
jgi:hypothetical protein